MAAVTNIRIPTTFVAIQADLHIKRLYWRRVDSVNVHVNEALLHVHTGVSHEVLRLVVCLSLHNCKTWLPAEHQISYNLTMSNLKHKRLTIHKQTTLHTVRIKQTKKRNSHWTHAHQHLTLFLVSENVKYENKKHNHKSCPLISAVIQ